MKWVVIGIAVVGCLLLGGGWLGGRGADNSDSQALATLFYLPGLVLLGVDVILLIGWGIVRLLFID